VWQSCRMDTQPATEKYKNHRFPVEIISHAVWLYFRFCLSFRDVEELLFERGVVVSYEAIHKWCRKFGQGYANQLRRRRPRPGDKWHMEVCQTQPINMTWGPLRLLNDTLTHLRGKLKREYVINRCSEELGLDICSAFSGSLPPSAQLSVVRRPKCTKPATAAATIGNRPSAWR
jgi:putative transposase